MQLLFLDTETNSLSPASGQIIEIAGIIAELDPITLKLSIVSNFQSLLHLNTPFEDKITRLTGIHPSDIEHAPHLNEVQENWRAWLENYHAVAVIGHSIDFDLGFLTSEKWYIPENLQIIDTLHAAKILFPTLSAVNLEYIFTCLDLESSWKTLFPSSTSDQLHRAMYDTEICLTFYQHALTELVSTKLIPSPFFEVATQILAPASVILFNSYTPLMVTEIPAIPLARSWTGTHYFDYNAVTSAITATLTPNQAFTQLEPYLTSITPDMVEYTVLLVAAVHGIAHKYTRPNNRVYLHIFGPRLYSYTTLLLSALTSAQAYEPKLDLDNLIPYFAQTQTTQLQFRNLLSLISLLKEFEELDTDLLNEFERLFDFWFLYASKLAYDGAINPYTDDPRIRGFFERFTELTQVAGHLQSFLLNCKLVYPLSHLVVTQLQQELTYLQNFDWKNGILETIALTEDDIRLVNTHVNPAFLEIVSRYDPLLSLTTYASQKSAEQLLTLLQLTDWIPNIKSLSNTTDYTAKLSGELGEKLDSLKDSKTLVLISQNKTLTKAQYHITTNWQSDSYLVYGESGSITKIQSKIALNYNVPVFVRLKDWNKFSSPRILQHFHQVVVIGLPYVHVPRTTLQKWGEKGKVNLLFLRTYQLEALAGQVHARHIDSLQYWDV